MNTNCHDEFNPTVEKMNRNCHDVCNPTGARMNCNSNDGCNPTANTSEGNDQIDGLTSVSSTPTSPNKKDTPVGNKSNQVHGCTLSISPGLTERYIPHCESGLKPFVGKQFAHLNDGIRFYREYAAACGFDMRLGGDKRTRGVITQKWVYCNREGNKNTVKSDVPNDPSKDDDVENDIGEENDSVVKQKKKRRRVSTRLDCKAHIILKLQKPSHYIISRFVEHHSHPLVPLVHRQFLDANKKLNPGHQNFILNCARANIGPMKSYRLFKEVVGTYSNIGCTSVEFKNFSRDLKAYALGVDAQMALDRLFKKKEISPAFVLEYDVNEKDQLTRVFWADAECRRNYAIFGDVVSFDATYSTNRYNMIFTPFTGKDNHGGCITFAAALLTKEDVDSYTWVLQKFKDCMGHCPLMIITDQDPALKIALERVFPGVRRRLCMWHIMHKLPLRLPNKVKDDDNFKSKLRSIVWTSLIEPSEFEDKWVTLMTEYGVQGDNWLNSIFEIRRFWIPAYFRDCPMSGLLRTTSMSESENNFYKIHFNHRSNLIEFFMFFEGALEKQRNDYNKLNNNNILSVSIPITPLLIERHASKVYTSTIFKTIQTEIAAACYHCTIVSITKCSLRSTYEITTGNSDKAIVTHDNTNEDVTCTCKKFTMMGLLCQHIFWVFKEKKLESIPDKYVLGRWTKSAELKPVHQLADNVLNDCANIDERKSTMNNLISDFYTCVGLVDGDITKMSTFHQCIKEQMVLLNSNEDPQSDPTCKKRLFENHFGAPAPEHVSVHPPNKVSTKGSGSRIVSRQEAAIVRNNKPLRTCGICGKKVRHDARTCPDRVVPVPEDAE